MPITRFFIVSGAGNFPFECLSFDACWPASDHDADAIRMSCPTVADQREISLATHGTGPTPQKWAEYHWRVVHCL